LPEATGVPATLPVLDYCTPWLNASPGRLDTPVAGAAVDLEIPDSIALTERFQRPVQPSQEADGHVPVTISEDEDFQMRFCPPRLLDGAFLILLLPLAGVFCPLPPSVAMAQAAKAAAKASGDTAPSQVRLQTSDGVDLAVWYYPAPKESGVQATVILIHDVGAGSHASLEKLAIALQRGGCAVVCPDLRGHGDSLSRADGDSTAAARPAAIKADLLRRADLEVIAAARGGTKRDQALIRGDIETVRDFLVEKAAEGEVDLDRLCVVGSGVGGTLASLWTAADWAWPPLASGPQGRQVRAVAVINPIWAYKGLSLSPALAAEPLKTTIPVMILAGGSERDAAKLAEQMKRFRPRGWFEQRLGEEPAKAKSLASSADASSFFIQVDSPLSADKLATEPETADRLLKFFGLSLDGPPKK
jgi:pimeloyl-ACP methyl ester carboxylesterase